MPAAATAAPTLVRTRAQRSGQGHESAVVGAAALIAALDQIPEVAKVRRSGRARRPSLRVSLSLETSRDSIPGALPSIVTLSTPPPPPPLQISPPDSAVDMRFEAPSRTTAPVDSHVSLSLNDPGVTNIRCDAGTPYPASPSPKLQSAINDKGDSHLDYSLSAENLPSKADSQTPPLSVVKDSELTKAAPIPPQSPNSASDGLALVQDSQAEKVIEMSHPVVQGELSDKFTIEVAPLPSSPKPSLLKSNNPVEKANTAAPAIANELPSVGKPDTSTKKPSTSTPLVSRQGQPVTKSNTATEKASDPILPSSLKPQAIAKMTATTEKTPVAAPSSPSLLSCAKSELSKKKDPESTSKPPSYQPQLIEKNPNPIAKVTTTVHLLSSDAHTLQKSVKDAITCNMQPIPPKVDIDLCAKTPSRSHAPSQDVIMAHSESPVTPPGVEHPTQTGKHKPASGREFPLQAIESCDPDSLARSPAAPTSKVRRVEQQSSKSSIPVTDVATRSSSPILSSQSPTIPSSCNVLPKKPNTASSKDSFTGLRSSEATPNPSVEFDMEEAIVPNESVMGKVLEIAKVVSPSFRSKGSVDPSDTGDEKYVLTAKRSNEHEVKKPCETDGEAPTHLELRLSTGEPPSPLPRLILRIRLNSCPLNKSVPPSTLPVITKHSSEETHNPVSPVGAIVESRSSLKGNEESSLLAFTMKRPSDKGGTTSCAARSPKKVSAGKSLKKPCVNASSSSLVCLKDSYANHVGNKRDVEEIPTSVRASIPEKPYFPLKVLSIAKERSCERQYSSSEACAIAEPEMVSKKNKKQSCSTITGKGEPVETNSKMKKAKCSLPTKGPYDEDMATSSLTRPSKELPLVEPLKKPRVNASSSDLATSKHADAGQLGNTLAAKGLTISVLPSASEKPYSPPKISSIAKDVSPLSEAHGNTIQELAVMKKKKQSCLKIASNAKLDETNSGSKGMPSYPSKKSIIKSGAVSSLGRPPTKVPPVKINTFDVDSSKHPHVSHSVKVGIEKKPPISVLASTSKERTSRAKALPKRVRFKEPPSQGLRTSRRNAQLLRVIHRRNYRFSLDSPPDLSVVSANIKGPDEKNHQVLLDELQYLLDGIFKIDVLTESGSKLVITSLQALVKLLLRKDSNRHEPQSLDNVLMRNNMALQGAIPESNTVIDMLVAQPDLLTKIVKRLSAMLGKSRSVDALVSLVFVILFRSAGSALLVSPREIDLMLHAFFHNCGTCLLEDGLSSRTRKPADRQEEKSPGWRRFGVVAQRVDDGKGSGKALGVFNKLVSDARVVEDDDASRGGPIFTREADGAAYLLSSALTALLISTQEVRLWMRDNRRLDRIVAVLYSAEKIYKDWTADMRKKRVEDGVCGASWRIVVGGAMRMLELASLDEVCQSRICLETRVMAIAVDVVRWVDGVRVGGGLDSEWVICNALKLCINLIQGYEGGAPQFTKAGGAQVVLDCLTAECVAAQLLQADEQEKESEGSDDDISKEGETREKEEPMSTSKSEESFDVRILCLVLLASVVDWELELCEEFSVMQSTVFQAMDAGGLGIALEILKRGSIDDDGDETMVEKQDDFGSNTRTENENPSKMERKLTIGYACLLIGALVRRSDRNRTLLMERLPENGLNGIAEVLQEFLDFHHEVGVISSSMDAMYERIISALREDVEMGDDVLDADLFQSKVGADDARLLKADKSINVDNSGDGMMDIDEELGTLHTDISITGREDDVSNRT